MYTDSVTESSHFFLLFVAGLAGFFTAGFAVFFGAGTAGFCTTMGLGYALSEEVHFKGRKILDLNFDTYELPRFSWLPRIETVLLDSPELPITGGGEPPIINMGAVVANAIFDAVGARLYQLPMTPERVKAALAEAKAKG